MRKSIGASFLIAAFVWCVSVAGVSASSAAERDVLSETGLGDAEPMSDQADGQNTEEAGKYERVVLASTKLEKAVDPDSYVLGPYDGIVVSIMGPEPRVFSLTVLPEGDVLMPGVGVIHADGLTLTEFRRALASKVDAYFHNIELYCYLETPAAFRVFVTGEVERPGAVEVSGMERVTDAIEKAGRVAQNGSRRLITL